VEAARGDDREEEDRHRLREAGLPREAVTMPVVRGGVTVAVRTVSVRHTLSSL
jgi:hypothetical protein